MKQFIDREAAARHLKQVEEFVHLLFLSLTKEYQQLNSKILFNKKDFKGSSGYNI